MPERGWKNLLAGGRWFEGEGHYPIAAYSEFMPPPMLGRQAYQPSASGSRGASELGFDPFVFDRGDAWGWRVSEYEDARELRPGLEQLAGHLLKSMRRLGRGEPAHGIAHNKLEGNVYWPEELHSHGAPAQERYVVLSALALSRTQDDKGRVRWTLFGGSEQGPSRAFWNGFFTAPGRERPVEWSLDMVRRLLAGAYGEPIEKLANLRRAGFRVMAANNPPLPRFSDGPLPAWTNDVVWSKGQSLRGVRWLLTFEPFASLPGPVRSAYLAGELHLLPFPGSLLFWGCADYLRMAGEFPLAVQLPLLHLFERHEAPRGIRVPQSGWMHEPRPGEKPNSHHGPLRGTFQRTHRWAKVHRHEDDLAVDAREDKVAHVLFSAAADDLGLYGKPMGRNAQVWTRDHQLLLDGPRATRQQLFEAARKLEEGGLFGYRFVYPAMRVGWHEVFWHRPLVAYLSAGDEPVVVSDAPLGYLTAYDTRRPKIDRPIELWPRLADRPEHRAAIELFARDRDPRYHVTTLNVRKLLQTWELLGERPLPRSFARQLLTAPKEESLEAWLASLADRSSDRNAAATLVDTLEKRLAPADADTPAEPARRARPRSAAARRSQSPANDAGDAPQALTYDRTARRSFETAYWRTIYKLAAGRYVNKDNADCVLDRKTRAKLVHHHRDLEALGDYLLAYYRRLAKTKQMSRQMLVGELPFYWRTDFDFRWSGGWSNNQEQVTYERDLMVVIPGRDRGRAVIMADHYDTAYMEDVYGYTHGGHGPRVSAAGADDNHSATAALMLGAPVFMDLSRAGQLACDIWLVHLTGEEFPSDCLGARHLTQCLVEGTLKLHVAGGKPRDLSKTRVQGLYVLDMVAHNNDRDRDVFQICPGTSREAMWLALQAHKANRAWNHLSRQWNERPNRRGLGRGRRSADGKTLPNIAQHPWLHGEVRPTYDPRSTLYNTDGQIFSDAGVPAVLFMENYDINRKGYHDTHDTMANIDLDYGSAVASIAIESVARAATGRPEDGIQP